MAYGETKNDQYVEVGRKQRSFTAVSRRAGARHGWMKNAAKNVGRTQSAALFSSFLRVEN
jgi:hypothetical protein